MSHLGFSSAPPLGYWGEGLSPRVARTFKAGGLPLDICSHKSYNSRQINLGKELKPMHSLCDACAPRGEHCAGNCTATLKRILAATEPVYKSD